MAQEVASEKLPQIAAAVNLGVRASLVDAKVAGAVRDWLAKHDPEALARLDATAADGWVRVEDHVAMLEAAATVLGLDGLAELARTRTRTTAVGSIFPQIVGSWTRSFAGDPGAVAQIVEPLTRATFRNVGTIVWETGPLEAKTRFGQNPWLARSAAWRAHILGTTQGIHDLAGTEVTVTFALIDDETVDILVRWKPEVTAHAG